MRTIFASLARAHERVRMQNVRDCPQTNLDSEINAPFLFNEHGDPHFLFHNFNEDNTLNNLAETYGYFFGKWSKYYRERYNGPNTACSNYVSFKG